jgi:hypothetical protein
MTQHEADNGPRLPPAPQILLDALRSAEASLDDVAAEIRALREVLDREPSPLVTDVAHALDTVHTGEVDDKVGVADHVSVTLHVPTATATATAPVPQISIIDPPAEVTSWVDKAKEYGPTGLRIADLALRAWNAIHGGL